MKLSNLSQKFIFSIFALLVLLGWLAPLTIGSDSLMWSSWSYSDWLISYAGGFIRRGLTGEIREFLFPQHETLQSINILVFAANASFWFLFLLLGTLQKRLRVWHLALLMFLPGMALQILATEQFFFRKEILFLTSSCLLALALYGLQEDPTKQRARRLFGVTLVLTSLAGAPLTLIHESYVFIALPFHILLGWIGLKKMGFSPAKVKLSGLLVALPTLAAFAACLMALSDDEISLRIWNSLSESDRTYIGEDWVADNLSQEIPTRAIGALGWSLKEFAIESMASLLSNRLGLWLLLGLAAGGTVLGWISLVTRNDNDQRKGPLFLSMLIVLFVSSLPLFMIAVDYGRWISMILTQTLIFAIVSFSARWEPQDLPPLLERFSQREFSYQISAFWESIPVKSIVIMILCWSFFVGLPEGAVRKAPSGLFSMFSSSFVDSLCADGCRHIK